VSHQFIINLATLVNGDATDGFMSRSFASASKLRDYTARNIETAKIANALLNDK
jgi:hypothetical protein